MTINHTPTDALSYLLLLIRDRLEWATDQIGGNTPSINATADEMYDGNEHVLNDLSDLVKDVEHIALPHLDSTSYSDGRPIRSSIEIQEGHTFSHVWHPDPTQERKRTVPVQIPGGEAQVTITPPAMLTAITTRRLSVVDDQGGQR
jgi:hypothetical protein